MSTARTRFTMAVLPVLAIALTGCVAQPAASLPDATAVPTETTTIPTPAATADGLPTVGRPRIEPPPDARLSVEGGDPITGQLGTFVWGGGGSDSPWLPGTPIGAAPGETLRVSLTPPVAMSGWSALLAPAANTAGAGSVNAGAGSVGAGSGLATMEVTAPEAGSWTLAVTIAFGDLGSATYFWRLEIL